VFSKTFYNGFDVLYLNRIFEQSYEKTAVTFSCLLPGSILFLTKLFSRRFQSPEKICHTGQSNRWEFANHSISDESQAS
jgi:hypothetical protein